jgi:SAM-dependent methyltransferase
VTSLDAYRDAASAWAGQAGTVYARLARAVVGDCPIPVEGATVLDLGAGTGVVSDLVAAKGARVVAVDLSEDMLRHDRAGRPAPVLADALALPFRRSSFDAVIAACLVNHFERPADAIRAAAGVVRPGGAVVASAFSAVPDPMKGAIDGVATRHGWEPPEWYLVIKRASATHLGDPDRMAETGRAAGLHDVVARRHDVPMSGLTTEQAVGYRLSLPTFTPWLDSLSPSDHAQIVAEAMRAAEPIVPTWSASLIVLSGLVS